MSTTLTNGLKLPDKGSVDWYADMQNNYAILDGAVGTVAEHTSQITGKAPLVHTHTKSDITDFPAYGTTAGTICEGNDSRLSDARTPVAHTHTKADVTNLFNSANTWTNEQTCGSNSPKWVNKNNNLAIGIAPASNQTCAFYNYDKDGNEIGRLISRIQPDGKTITWVSATNLYKNGALDPTGSAIWSMVQCCINSNGYAHVITNCDFIPADGSINLNLGTSTNKWKTLNGVNPGALSLPSSDSADYIDLSSNLNTNTEYLYTAPYDGWLCLYVNVNEFYTENAIGLYRSDTSANSHQWAKSVTAAVNLYKQNRYQGSVMLPVESGKKYICYISLNANATIHGKYLFFYKNKGNV